MLVTSGTIQNWIQRNELKNCSIYQVGNKCYDILWIFCLIKEVHIYFYYTIINIHNLACYYTRTLAILLKKNFINKKIGLHKYM